MNCKSKFKSGFGEHWRRQIGDVHPSAFARRIGVCEDLVSRLVMYAELLGHRDAVHTVSFNPSGELLVSGSSDCDIRVWNWASKERILTYRSGHHISVLQACVMPYSDDRVIVSCGADGQVRSGTILQDGTMSTKNLTQHSGRADKLALEPGNSHIFYSCGQDGVVVHFDLREEKSTKLLTCHRFRTSSGTPRRSIMQLNAIVMNPVNLNYFAVGGSDQYARVYDIRRVKTNGPDQPVECYAPRHLQEPAQGEHITCVAYSHRGELLASYNEEFIYLFEKSMSLGSNAEASHQEAPEPQVYQGHLNFESVGTFLFGFWNSVNFFGPGSEYVISGSSCGRIFIWKKMGGNLVAMVRGALSKVRCVEPHPHAPILATNGDRPTVKVWAPVSLPDSPLMAQIPDFPDADVEDWRPYFEY